MTSTLKIAALSLAFVAVTAFAANAADRRFIHDGMSEGEVIYKIGPPDSETRDTGYNAEKQEKRWIYYPAPGDSQTLTTLVIRDGKVIHVKREIAR